MSVNQKIKLLQKIGETKLKNDFPKKHGQVMGSPCESSTCLVGVELCGLPPLREQHRNHWQGLQPRRENKNVVDFLWFDLPTSGLVKTVTPVLDL